MPRPLLLSALSDNWAYMAPFLASALALMTGYLLSVLTSRRSANATHSTETANEKIVWRKSLLEALATNKEAIKTEKSERVQWQLKREAEAALVAGILEESAEAQKIMASIVSTVRHLEGGQTRIDGELRELRTHMGTIQSQLINLATTRHAHS